MSHLPLTNLTPTQKPRQATGSSVALSRCRTTREREATQFLRYSKPPDTFISSRFSFCFLYNCLYATLWLLFVCLVPAILPLESCPERCSDPRACDSSFHPYLCPPRPPSTIISPSFNCERNGIVFAAGFYHNQATESQTSSRQAGY